MPLLHWLTRDSDLQESNRAPYRVLEYVPALSGGDQDSENLLIQGDNLDALKSLLPYFGGAVKCVYIDPPFNTDQTFPNYDDNLSGQPRASFWLPTSTDRFYPDFVALLEDGRLLVVEYKGEGYVSNDDSKEKKLLGELWEAKSNGKGVFLMAEKTDELGRIVFAQIAAKLSST